MDDNRSIKNNRLPILLWAPALVLLIGALGVGGYFLLTPQETPVTAAEVATPSASMKATQTPTPKPAARMEVASLLFEPDPKVAGAWNGAIVLRDGVTIPVRIQDVDHTGFTAVAVRCNVGEACKIGAEVDQEVVDEEDVQLVVDALLAVAREITSQPAPPRQ